MKTLRTLLATVIVSAAATACAPESPTAAVPLSDPSYDGIGVGSGHHAGGATFGSGNYASTTEPAATAEGGVTLGSGARDDEDGGMGYGSGKDVASATEAPTDSVPARGGGMYGSGN